MSSPRILILRTSALGDIVHALPVLSALRRGLPHATIGWVVESTFAPLLDSHPDIDEVLVASLRIWRRSAARRETWREAIDFIRSLDRFSAEIALDLMGNHKAGALAALAQADRRLGLAAADRREPSSAIWMSETVAARGEHAVDRMLSVLEGLGLSPAAIDFGADKLPEAPPETPTADRPFVLLHPVTGWPNKDYPPAAWAEVATGIVAARGLEVLVAPGPGEEAVASELARRAGSGVRALPSISLPGLVYLQRRAQLVLGGDTGPIHLAHALGTPVLAVMGPTDPSRHGPYASPEMAIWHQLPCSFCHRRLDGPRACLLEIEPRAVLEKSLSLLGGGLH